MRAAATERLLSDPANRPAIVYAPTRRQAEALAEHLTTRFPAAAYHAGLTAARRDETQAAFLKGHIDVVVATIAFGMGIDKPDVRTVIHTAMPGSVEAYYQEIGRAGRDGLASRAVLLHGYVDRRTHEFFLDRDYPEPARLERIYNELNSNWQSKDALLDRVRVDADDLDRMLEKLWIHGGAIVDPEENVKRGDEAWRQAYRAQRRHKWAELDLITGYAGCRECRMLHLLRHFGDRDARGDACGMCDFCRPDDCQVLKFTEPGDDERAAMTRVLEALDERDDQATGRLHRDVFGESLARDDFENLLGALARAGLVEIRDDAFERDGKVIRFRRVRTTDRGRTHDALRTVRVPVSPESGLAQARHGRRPRKPKKKEVEDRPFHRTVVEMPEPVGDASPELIAALREWRLAEARRRRVPAFCILSNRSLTAIAEIRPRDEAALLRVHGMGSKRLEEFRAIDPADRPKSDPLRPATTMRDGTITTRDGRALGYAEYGDRAGKPVFYFHGFPGSRLEIGPASAAASDTRVRLIAVDRPGYGRSDFKPARTDPRLARRRDRPRRRPAHRAFRRARRIGRGAVPLRLRVEAVAPYHSSRDLLRAGSSGSTRGDARHAFRPTGCCSGWSAAFPGPPR